LGHGKNSLHIPLLVNVWNGRHQWPQLVQLVALHPVHDDAPADRLTVSPPPLLLTNPQADIIRLTFRFPHFGHSGLSLPMIRHSNFLSHASQ
jgi:hypothetical protein